jgi:hypothetical protein
VVTMAKKKGVRIIVTLECTEARGIGATPSRYCTQKVWTSCSSSSSSGSSSSSSAMGRQTGSAGRLLLCQRLFHPVPGYLQCFGGHCSSCLFGRCSRCVSWLAWTCKCCYLIASTVAAAK